MSLFLEYLLAAWGAVTAAFAVAVIYGQTLFSHEDDQLFLDPAESHLEKEQVEIQTKIRHLRPIMRGLGTASAVLLVVVVGLLLYQGWTANY
jgi:hypothetical protein